MVIFFCEIEGIKKRRIGPMINDVFWAENVSVDIQKMKPNQRNTGNQYLKFLLRLIFLKLKDPFYR